MAKNGDDPVKRLDRTQKRAKNWLRKAFADEGNMGPVISKLQKLLRDEVEPAANEVWEWARDVLAAHKGAKTKTYTNVVDRTERLHQLLMQVPLAVNDPRAFAEASTITYWESGEFNDATHLATLVEHIFTAARTVQSYVKTLQREGNPVSLAALKGKLLR